MIILSIDTSADETSVSITEGRKILANKRYSQILAHTQWGGIVPSIAKRAHIERIDHVVESALRMARLTTDKIDYIAVTYGPGLAVALEIGISKAKALSSQFDKKIIPVNHLEGHIYSCFVQNRKGNPVRPIKFPYLAFIVSGGHTELVILRNHLDYEVIGQTLDDAAGEALDKATKILGLGYPGGPIIERLSKLGNSLYHYFPRPMRGSKDLNFSFSGLKTSFLYFVRSLPEAEQKKHLSDLSASFQQAVFDSLIFKLENAVKQTGIVNVLLCGGVSANLLLRVRVRDLVKKYNGGALFPPFASLYGDNAAMIGVVAHFKAKAKIFIEDINNLEREPRAQL